MLIVRFIRADDQPAEEYYYNNISEAVHHIHLFKDDDSGLYRRIELIVYDSDTRFSEVAYAINF